jgi:hypothetical protein
MAILLAVARTYSKEGHSLKTCWRSASVKHSPDHSNSHVQSPGLQPQPTHANPPPKTHHAVWCAAVYGVWGTRIWTGAVPRRVQGIRTLRVLCQRRERNDEMKKEKAQPKKAKLCIHWKLEPGYMCFVEMQASDRKGRKRDRSKADAFTRRL